MKRVLACLSITALISCSAPVDNSAVEEINQLTSQLDSVRTVCFRQESVIASLRDSIELLKYPAEDRLISINSLLAKGELDRAETELNQLIKIFPGSKEAQDEQKIRSRISSEREKIRKERERLEALGFKALKQNSTVTVDYNKITLSAFSCGTQFSFDYYDDSWFYRTADRDNKYVTMSMSVTSKSKDPDLPQFAVYSVTGKNMTFVETFQTRYARWSDYGSYLGNYHDTRNDFSKVSTVYFRLGAEVNQAVTAGPYAIVMYNQNVLTEGYERFNDPPQYWTGQAPFARSLTLDSFESRYVLIKLFNLK